MQRRFLLSFTGLLTALLSYAQPAQSQPTQPAYPPAPTAPANISALEWFVDHDPGPGNGRPIPIPPGQDITVNPALALADITHGVHRLFVRSRNVDGRWSLLAATSFENLHPAYPAPPSALAAITQLEIFFDNDPGPGKGTIHPLTPATDIPNLGLGLGIDSLTKGDHTLFIRVPGSLTAFQHFNNNTPLPLTWLEVTARLKDHKAEISWITAAEQNTRDFQIQRSADGQHYESIGWTAASGNTTTPTTYYYTDPRPLTGMGYYRILQRDLDERASFSKVIPLFNGSFVQTPKAIPNPFTDHLTLLIPAAPKNAMITLFNAAGISLQTIRLTEGQQQQTLQLGNLAAGTYFLRVTQQGRTETITLLKQATY